MLASFLALFIVGIFFASCWNVLVLLLDLLMERILFICWLHLLFYCFRQLDHDMCIASMFMIFD